MREIIIHKNPDDVCLYLIDHQNGWYELFTEDEEGTGESIKLNRKYAEKILKAMGDGTNHEWRVIK